jgi:hypothetical protein
VPSSEGGWPAGKKSPRPNGGAAVPLMSIPPFGSNPSVPGRFVVGRAGGAGGRMLALSSRSSAFRYRSATRCLSASRLLRFSIVDLSAWTRSGLGWKLRAVGAGGFEADWAGGPAASRMRMRDGFNIISPFRGCGGRPKGCRASRIGPSSMRDRRWWRRICAVLAPCRVGRRPLRWPWDTAKANDLRPAQVPVYRLARFAR